MSLLLSSYMYFFAFCGQVLLQHIHSLALTHTYTCIYIFVCQKVNDRSPVQFSPLPPQKLQETLQCVAITVSCWKFNTSKHNPNPHRPLQQHFKCHSISVPLDIPHTHTANHCNTLWCTLDTYSWHERMQRHICQGRWRRGCSRAIPFYLSFMKI